jgi:hypothetical protein
MNAFSGVKARLFGVVATAAICTCTRKPLKSARLASVLKPILNFSGRIGK